MSARWSQFPLVVGRTHMARAIVCGRRRRSDCNWNARTYGRLRVCARTFALRTDNKGNGFARYRTRTRCAISRLDVCSLARRRKIRKNRQIYRPEMQDSRAREGRRSIYANEWQLVWI